MFCCALLVLVSTLGVTACTANRSDDAGAWRTNNSAADDDRPSGPARFGDRGAPRDRDTDSHHSSEQGQQRTGPRADDVADWRGAMGSRAAETDSRPAAGGGRFGRDDRDSRDRGFGPREDRDSRDRGFAPRDDRDRGGFGDRDRSFAPRDDREAPRWRGADGARSGDARREDRPPIFRPGVADDASRWRRDTDNADNNAAADASSAADKPAAAPAATDAAPASAQPATSTESAPASADPAAKPAAETKDAPAPEAHKPAEYKPLKTKKLEPGVKLNPFGAALPPVPAEERKPKPVPRTSDGDSSANGASAASTPARLSTSTAPGSSSASRFGKRDSGGFDRSAPEPSLSGRKPLQLSSAASTAAAAAAAAALDAPKAAPAAPRAFDESLGAADSKVQVLSAKDQKKVPLYKAMEKANSVSLDELVDGMAKLDLQLSTVSVQKELATVIARSLWDKKFGFEQAVSATKDKLGSHKTAVFTAALEWFKTKTVRSL